MRSGLTADNVGEQRIVRFAMTVVLSNTPQHLLRCLSGWGVGLVEAGSYGYSGSFRQAGMSQTLPYTRPSWLPLSPRRYEGLGCLFLVASNEPGLKADQIDVASEAQL
jgi:hypothetical protein